MSQQFTPAQVIISQAEYAHLKREARRNSLAEEQDWLYREALTAALTAMRNSPSSTMNSFIDILRRQGKVRLTLANSLVGPYDLKADDIKVTKL